MKKSILFALGLASLVYADMDRCVSCHGVDFEKKALGVSKVVKNMSEQEIKAALDGYKRGEGGKLKDIMIKEVNLGVDTNAMAADVYNEAHTPGFERPDSEFIFKKRRTVRTLHKLKKYIKDSKEEDLSKVKNKIKSTAFTYYVYDKYLRDHYDFNSTKANEKPLNLEDMYKKVSEVKTCTDHSFSEEALFKCRLKFENLAGSLVLDEVKAQKEKKKAKK